MNFIERLWYSRDGDPGWLLLVLLRLLLLPLSWLFFGVAVFRHRRFLKRRIQRPPWLRVPVVVVGNISVGGNGKTPLLIAVATHLKSHCAMQPGVISRGYGGKAPSYPLLLGSGEPLPDPAHCGDEPLLIAEKTGCPVVVDPDRRAALRHLLATCPDVDVVLSDDGLQHYRLFWDMEVTVLDGERLFGNRLCLPAGPLRESPSRLHMSDFVVINGGNVNRFEDRTLANLEREDVFYMAMKPRHLSNLLTGEKLPIDGKMPFKADSRVQAVAGIGNPERFFHLLKSLPCLTGLNPPVACFSFPDHYSFSPENLQRAGVDLQQPVIMTEKDGVKCRSFATAHCWVLEAEAEFSTDFLAEVHLELMALENDIEAVTNKSTASNVVDMSDAR